MFQEEFVIIQIVQQIPKIDFDKYDVRDPKFLREPELHEEGSTSTSKLLNKNLWTSEEQRRLEELLNKFPPEPTESHRFAKIAKAMGNRTPKQIASRVQKFFKKLHEANLPIPGSSCNKSLRRQAKSRKNQFKPERLSTFFPERNIPDDLLMKDDLDDELCVPKYQNSSCAAQPESDGKLLSLLKLIRAEKLKNLDSFENVWSGHKCISCCENLCAGMRWHCNDCKAESSYCSDCLTSQLLSNTFCHLYHNVQVS